VLLVLEKPSDGGVEVFQTLKTELKKKGYSIAIGDEGGFAPNLSSHREALELILSSIEIAGFKPGKDIYLALDPASSEFYREGRYHLKSENKSFSSQELTDYYVDMVNQYPLISIEDGLAEEDWLGWKYLTDALGKRIQLVGDDLFVTQTQYLQKGIQQGIANAILIKLNQVGTLTETLAAIHMARKAAYGFIISHRSGETEDTFISDLAVATASGQIKTGSLCRTDRVAKYNQLLRIEEMLPPNSFAGKNAFKGRVDLQ